MTVYGNGGSYGAATASVSAPAPSLMNRLENTTAGLHNAIGELEGRLSSVLGAAPPQAGEANKPMYSTTLQEMVVRVEMAIQRLQSINNRIEL